MLYAGKFGLGWAHDAFKFACHMFMHTYLTVFIIWFYNFLVLLWFSLSLSLSLSLALVALWHLNVSPLHLGTFFILGHLLRLLLLTPLPLTSNSVMKMPNRTSWRTFHDKAFIRNSKSFCQIFLTLTYPLSSTIRVESHFVASQSRALLWSYRSSTSICTNLIILHPSLSLAFRVYVW